MPLWTVRGPTAAVIVNASSRQQAIEFAGMADDAGSQQASLSTAQDVATIPLWASTQRGDFRPASVADPAFVNGFGLGKPSYDEPSAGGLTNATQDPTPPTTYQPSARINEDIGGGGRALPFAPLDPFTTAGESAAGTGSLGSGSGGTLMDQIPQPRTPPPGPPVPTNPVPQGIDEQEYGAQFLRALMDRGVDSNTISGRAASGPSRFNTYANTYQFHNALRGLDPKAQPSGDFQSFVRSNDLSGARSEAASILSQLYGGSGAFPQGAQNLAAQYNAPDAQGATDLQQLAMNALMSRISPMALELLRLPSGRDIRDRFIAQGGGDKKDFLTFFRSMFPTPSA